jgi:hypothetical protein
VTVTDPEHRSIARALRTEFAATRDRGRRGMRSHSDGHVVALRALPDYDALFGVDVTAFDPAPATVSCSIVVVCRTLTLVCCTQITAMSASRMVPNRSRWAATSSLTRTR